MSVIVVCNRDCANMAELHYPKHLIIERAAFTEADRALIRRLRTDHNRLGVAYLIAFVRLTGRFPQQAPFEVQHDVLGFTASELGMDPEDIWQYARVQSVISRHEDRVRAHINLARFSELDAEVFCDFVYSEACRLEESSALHARTIEFLQGEGFLVPAASTLKEIIAAERKRAREMIFGRLSDSLPIHIHSQLKDLLRVPDNAHFSPLHGLKQPPGAPSAKAMLDLIDRLDRIMDTGVPSLDLSWINNNFKKVIARRARYSDAARLGNLKLPHRHTALVCFLWEAHHDTVDQIVDMFHKLLTDTFGRADRELGEEMKSKRTSIKALLQSFMTVGGAVADTKIAPEAVRPEVFSKIPPPTLEQQLEQAKEWVHGKKSDAFAGVVRRFGYLRRFAPQLLRAIEFRAEPAANRSVLQAIDILRELNRTGKRKLPARVPLDFVPKKYWRFVEVDGAIDKHGYECAALTVLDEQIRAGNIYVLNSRRYARLEDFFMPRSQWLGIQEAFYGRAKLPSKRAEVGPYLTARLDGAYDRFLEALPGNDHVRIEESGWSFASDPGEEFSPEEKEKLDALESWLTKHVRRIKLPDLLIEVDNELGYTRHFVPLPRRTRRLVEDVCQVIATIIAHGCNIGPYTMAEITNGVSYKDIQRISDWHLHAETLRAALADIVNAILRLDAARVWGEGKTASGDGQRFLFRPKVLSRTYSHRLRDYGLEFYTFVADNYAPFFSLRKECTERDAPFALDGALYHESDVDPYEWYFDTSGYVELNFLGFMFIGKLFCPRIRGLHRQWIYRITKDRDYGGLKPIVCRKGHTIHLDWIVDQWDRIGHFFASLATGHATASVAMKRLISCGDQNVFYRGAREAARVFKTEGILDLLRDPELRQRQRRGLLKGEQVHALSRDVFYGKGGRVDWRDYHRQMGAASCLTMIVAAITYFQIKEVERVLGEHDPEAAGIDISMLEHISPVSWQNILLYGEYKLNRDLVKGETSEEAEEEA